MMKEMMKETSRQSHVFCWSCWHLLKDVMFFCRDSSMALHHSGVPEQTRSKIQSNIVHWCSLSFIMWMLVHCYFSDLTVSDCILVLVPTCSPQDDPASHQSPTRPCRRPGTSDPRGWSLLCWTAPTMEKSHWMSWAPRRWPEMAQLNGNTINILYIYIHLYYIYIQWKHLKTKKNKVQIVQWQWSPSLHSIPSDIAPSWTL